MDIKLLIKAIIATILLYISLYLFLFLLIDYPEILKKVLYVIVCIVDLLVVVWSFYKVFKYLENSKKFEERRRGNAGGD